MLITITKRDSFSGIVLLYAVSILMLMVLYLQVLKKEKIQSLEFGSTKLEDALVW